MHLGRERVIGCWQVDDVLDRSRAELDACDTLLAALGDSAAARDPADPHPSRSRRRDAARWPSAGPRWRSTCTSAARATWPIPSRLVESAPRGSTATTWTGCGARCARSRGTAAQSWSAARRCSTARFEVAYTPGHASHHVSYRHDGTAFVGDVGGVRITPDSIVVPPTPPPDIDVEAWQRSIAVIRGWAPERLAMTHFGDSDDVDGAAGRARARAWTPGRSWPARATATSSSPTVQAEILRDGSPEQAATYQQAAPSSSSTPGYERYWSKRG